MMLIVSPRGVESNQERDVECGTRVEHDVSAHIEKGLGAGTHQLLEDSCARLLVVSEDRERAGSVARHHRSRHQHGCPHRIASRRELPIHDSTARSLRVIHARSEEARAGNIQDSGVPKRSIVIPKHTVVIKTAGVVGPRVIQWVRPSSVDKCAGGDQLAKVWRWKRN